MVVLVFGTLIYLTVVSAQLNEDFSLEASSTKNNDLSHCSTSPTVESLIYQLLLSSFSQRLGAIVPEQLVPTSKSLPEVKTSVVIIERPQTITETIQKVLPIWFRNKRIMSTINDFSTYIITETVTHYSTATVGTPQVLIEPFNEIRKKRDAEDIEPSFVQPGELTTTGTSQEFQAAWRRIEENLEKRQISPNDEKMSLEEKEARRMTKELLKTIEFQEALKRIEQSVQKMVEKKFESLDSNEVQ
ncbi:uncharacterized protein LOC136034701 [Artemia franciscana]|uniref:Uncharacterized protein n=1 Tax=Artemia franciscana TaxID=6661 RepID=A0AA88L8F8_ARTSF|nr:hypothetical protein QYM36_002765 [Artemia franciscana]